MGHPGHAGTLLPKLLLCLSRTSCVQLTLPRVQRAGMWPRVMGDRHSAEPTLRPPGLWPGRLRRQRPEAAASSTHGDAEVHLDGLVHRPTQGRAAPSTCTLPPPCCRQQPQPHRPAQQQVLAFAGGTVQPEAITQLRVARAQRLYRQARARDGRAAALAAVRRPNELGKVLQLVTWLEHATAPRRRPARGWLVVGRQAWPCATTHTHTGSMHHTHKLVVAHANTHNFGHPAPLRSGCLHARARAHTRARACTRMHTRARKRQHIHCSL